MTQRKRIDKLLYERGFAESRTKALAMVMAGIVLVDEQRVEKPSETFAEEVTIRIKGSSAVSRYASRGGLKLEHALSEFGVDPLGCFCLDVGSSTGGFTDCLLQHGAASVTAIDAGTNQLAWKLRNDPRVEVHENTNARSLRPEMFDRTFDIAVIDVSFISVRKILPAVKRLISEKGKIIVLIKPQFEVGKGEVGKGGIVRDPEQHQQVVDDINSFAASIGLCKLGLTDSPITGAAGNREFLAVYGQAK